MLPGPPGFLYFEWLSGATLKSDFSLLIFVDSALRRPRALSGHFPGPPAGDWIGTTYAYLRCSRSMHSTIYAYLLDSRNLLSIMYAFKGFVFGNTNLLSRLWQHLDFTENELQLVCPSQVNCKGV